MRRRFVALPVVVLVALFGATACEGAQQDIQKRAQDEVDKGREQVEQRVQEERKKVEDRANEERTKLEQRVGEERKKVQDKVKKEQ